MYRHILVPTDGTGLSLKAARTAARLAKHLKAKITVLHVIAPYIPPYGSEDVIFYPKAKAAQEYKVATEKAAGLALAKAAAAAKALDVPCARLFLVGTQPWSVILQAARARKCDLVVMASHGRRGFAGLLIGSETTKVLTHSKVPVLVCR